MTKSVYREKVYAGVLGKMIGVYHGRPIEGWSYEKIRHRFDMVDRYVASDLHIPLHVADDDLAGTFTFLNILEDYVGDLRNITSEDFGKGWLDYIIENKTIFWWGGIGRSTEHTAFMNLKRGIKAPKSGSAARNGKGISEQIGAQIFMDALAMICPGDPAMARDLVRKSASVSHDGLAVESACFLASLEAMAFEESNLDKLLTDGLRLSESQELIHIVSRVWEYTKSHRDFRLVRQWLDDEYGYHLYPGNCHVVPNLALIIACLVLGEDNFTDALHYCVSAGWDTDCNGANIGVINGIRLGLPALKSGYDFRSPLADWFYCISGEGGAAVTDGVKQTKRIVALHERLYESAGLSFADNENKHYDFSLPGSVQGFIGCPVNGKDNCCPSNISEQHTEQRGLCVTVGSSGKNCVSTPVMWDPQDKHGGYQLIGSPTLYETQTVNYHVQSSSAQVMITPYVVYYDFDDQLQVISGPTEGVGQQSVLKSWMIPSLGGKTLSRIGFCVEGKVDSQVIISDIDWNGAPENYTLTGSLKNDDLGRPNMQLLAFTASAKQFSFDRTRTLTVSDTDTNGLAVIGDQYWEDYSLCCSVTVGLNERFGLIIRSKGLRRYYAVILQEMDTMQLVCREGEIETVLAESHVSYELDKVYQVRISAVNDEISAEFAGTILCARDSTLKQGGCGFRVDRGTILVSDICIAQQISE